MDKKQMIGSEWADAEIKRLAESLEAKRQEAIKYLGDKWLLKGGTYNPNMEVLK